MGRWGDGNLENDGASDFLYGFSKGYFDKIMFLLQNPRAYQYDEDEYYELFCLIEVISALHDKGLIYWAPEQNEVSFLIKSFLLKLYDYESCNEKRKMVIENTFTEFMTVIREFHDAKTDCVEVEDMEQFLKDHPESKIIFDIFDSLEKKSTDGS